jgi:hypothetical protein
MRVQDITLLYCRDVVLKRTKTTSSGNLVKVELRFSKVGLGEETTRTALKVSSHCSVGVEKKSTGFGREAAGPSPRASSTHTT